MGQSRVPRDATMSPEVRKFLDQMDKDLGAITTAQIGAAGTTQTDWISCLIKAPLNQDYRLDPDLDEVITITKFSAKTASGTVTVELKLNSTLITGASINATSTLQSVTPTALNVNALHDALVLTCSAISSPVDLTIKVWFTRTLSN